MDVLLSLGTSMWGLPLVGAIACYTHDLDVAVVFFIIPALYYFIGQLFRRRLGINIFANGIDIHYLPWFFIQRGKTVHLSFADIADCEIRKVRFLRYNDRFLVIVMKNGKRYKVTSWIPAFQNVFSYATNCEEHITTAFREFTKQATPGGSTAAIL